MSSPLPHKKRWRGIIRKKGVFELVVGLSREDDVLLISVAPTDTE